MTAGARAGNTSLPQTNKLLKTCGLQIWAGTPSEKIAGVPPSPGGRKGEGVATSKPPSSTHPLTSPAKSRETHRGKYGASEHHIYNNVLLIGGNQDCA